MNVSNVLETVLGVLGRKRCVVNQSRNSPRPESRRPGAAGQRPTAPRALPSVRASGYLASLISLLLLAAPPAAADFLGIPLARQPFIKVCPDGTIVGSLGPNLSGIPTETIGASIYDPRTRTTTFIRRDAPDFEERLAANSCVRKPIGASER